MSTHRKIEWALFIVGLVGVATSILFIATMIQISLFAIGALFAGLHAFKLYDGHKSNHVVVATSIALVIYTGYIVVMNLQNFMSLYDVTIGLVIAIFLSILSLRLRRDFHRK